MDSPRNEVFVFDPPQPNNKLRLGDLLKFRAGNVDRLWLSVKNLNSANIDLVVNYLNELIPEDRRSRVLIETSAVEDLERGARRIRGAGYRLSYYLPTEAGARCSRNPSDIDCAGLKDGISALFARIPFSGLAFDVRAFAFVSSLALPDGIEWHVRDLGVKGLEDIDRIALRASRMYIVPFESRFNY